VDKVDEQRLKEMVVTAVEQGHPHRPAGQRAGRVEPAEAAAHDDHVREGRHFLRQRPVSSLPSLLLAPSPSSAQMIVQVQPVCVGALSIEPRAGRNGLTVPRGRGIIHRVT